mgnify:CR=1 FL=1
MNKLKIKYTTEDEIAKIVIVNNPEQNELILEYLRGDFAAEKEIKNTIGNLYKTILDELQANKIQCKFLNRPPQKFHVKFDYDFEIYDPKIK